MPKVMKIQVETVVCRPSRFDELPHQVVEITLGPSRSYLKILFTFENPLPSPEADAEVFVNTARCLSPLVAKTWLHAPLSRGTDTDAREAATGRSPGGKASRARHGAMPSGSSGS